MFGRDNTQSANNDDSNNGAQTPATPDPMTLGQPSNNSSTTGPNDNSGSTPSLPNNFSEMHQAANALPGNDSASSQNDSDAPSPGNVDALIDIKQKALQQLSPLVSHLDQSPEEKFRTTMMMIQATDDQNLIQEAYDAAQQITDDKAKAQALLDVINEINYFSQHQNGSN